MGDPVLAIEGFGGVYLQTHLLYPTKFSVPNETADAGVGPGPAVRVPAAKPALLSEVLAPLPDFCQHRLRVSSTSPAASLSSTRKTQIKSPPPGHVGNGSSVPDPQIIFRDLD